MPDPEIDELKKRILCLTEDLAGLKKELAASKSSSDNTAIKEEIRQLAASLEPMRARLKELTPDAPPEPKKPKVPPGPDAPTGGVGDGRETLSNQGGGANQPTPFGGGRYELGHFEGE